MSDADDRVKLPRQGVRHHLVTVGWVGREALRSFAANRDFESAATLAYYGFLALMPFLLLLIFTLGLVMRSSEAVLGAVQGLTHELFPSFSASILQDLLGLARQRVWGAISLVVLAWSLTPFTGAMRSCIEQIFRVEKKRSFLHAKVLDISAALVLLAMFVALVLGKMLAPAPHAGGMMFLGWLTDGLVFLGVVLAVAFFYRVFSSVSMPWSHLAAGAVTTTALLTLIRPLFGLVLRFNPDYGYVFGSLKAVFLIVIWAYYTFAVVLLGVELMATLRRKDALLLRGLLSAPVASWKAPSRLISRFVKECPGGQVLFREDAEGHDMYVVLEGAVTLTRSGDVLRAMKAGDFFGEMSMLLDAPRTATATVAEEGAKLVRIARDNFEMILRENPDIVQALLKEMALRLRAMNERVNRPG